MPSYSKRPEHRRNLHKWSRKLKVLSYRGSIWTGQRVEHLILYSSEPSGLGCYFLQNDDPHPASVYWDGLVSKVEKLLDVSLNVAGQEPSAVPLEWLPVRTNEELLKVPGDIIPADRTPDDALGISHEGHGLVRREWQLLLQKLEKRISVLPVHVYLLQELKLWLKAISRTDILQGQ